MEMYQKIAKYYDHIFPYKPQQKKFILSADTRRRRYCDIACGTGSLALSLTNQFKDISAFDSSQHMINIANEEAVEGVDFFTGSLLKTESYFISSEPFDVVSCFGNSIVHLHTEEDILNFFRQVRNILDENGVFLGQLINYDYVLEEKLTGLPTIENKEVRFVRHYHLNNDELPFDFDTELTIKSTGEVIDNTIHLLPLRKTRLNVLLLEAGFSSVEFFSDFTRSPYKETALPLVFQANY